MCDNQCMGRKKGRTKATKTKSLIVQIDWKTTFCFVIKNAMNLLFWIQSKTNEIKTLLFYIFTTQYQNTKKNKNKDCFHKYTLKYPGIWDSAISWDPNTASFTPRHLLLSLVIPINLLTFLTSFEICWHLLTPIEPLLKSLTAWYQHDHSHKIQ